MQYFQLAEESNDLSWGVKVPPSQFENQQAIWFFSEGKKLDLSVETRLDIDAGEPKDFMLTGFSIPVVSDAFREVIETGWPGDIQFLHTTCDQDVTLWILNVLHNIDCIDYEESVIQVCNNKGRAFRHRFGKPEMISKLIIDRSKVNGRHIFRIADWRPAIIVSEAVRNALDQGGLQGVGFSPV